MSLDFLRRLAFDGELAAFFREDAHGFGERMTGIHLRFDPRFLRSIAEQAAREPAEVANGYDRSTFLDRLNDILADWSDEKNHFFYWPYGDGERRRSIVQILVDMPTKESRIGGFDEGLPPFYQGFQIIYREMDAIVPHYTGGDDLRSSRGKQGTLCGFLLDPTSKQHFALTCGHVAELPNTTFSNPNYASQLGITTNVELPSGVGNCNRAVQAAANGVDAALVEIGASVLLTLGPSRVVEPISAISSGDYVDFMGQGSRRTGRGMVMSATIWKKIDLLNDGNLKCCGDIFEISHRSIPYVQSALSQPGDSGAAVTRPAAPGDWLGMLIGGQRSSSFVCYAEHIMSWANTVRPGIRLYP